jgi:hypothetical protein
MIFLIRSALMYQTTKLTGQSNGMDTNQSNTQLKRSLRTSLHGRTAKIRWTLKVGINLMSMLIDVATWVSIRS